MKHTANYNLKKPDRTDFVNIDDINSNMDAIDTKLKELEGRHVEVVNDLNSNSITMPLSANMGRELKETINNIPRTPINNTLTSDSTTEALSAAKGKELKELADRAFQSASEGKQLLATTLTGLGEQTENTSTFSTIATKITGAVNRWKNNANSLRTTVANKLTALGVPTSTTASDSSIENNFKLYENIVNFRGLEDKCYTIVVDPYRDSQPKIASEQSGYVPVGVNNGGVHVVVVGGAGGYYSGSGSTKHLGGPGGVAYHFIPCKSGDIIKYRLGDGGRVSSNYNELTNGGDTYITINGIKVTGYGGLLNAGELRGSVRNLHQKLMELRGKSSHYNPALSYMVCNFFMNLSGTTGSHQFADPRSHIDYIKLGFFDHLNRNLQMVVNTYNNDGKKRNTPGFILIFY